MINERYRTSPFPTPLHTFADHPGSAVLEPPGTIPSNPDLDSAQGSLRHLQLLQYESRPRKFAQPQPFRTHGRVAHETRTELWWLAGTFEWIVPLLFGPFLTWILDLDSLLRSHSWHVIVLCYSLSLFGSTSDLRILWLTCLSNSARAIEMERNLERSTSLLPRSDDSHLHERRNPPTTPISTPS